MKKQEEYETNCANRQETDEEDHGHLRFKIDDFRLTVGIVANLQSEI